MNDTSPEFYTAILNNPQRITVTFVARGRVQLQQSLLAWVYGELVTIAPGYESDGASVPAPMWWPFGHPFSGALLFSALFHDYLCREQGWSQPQVSRWFQRDLRAHGVGRFRAWCFWCAVRFFGPRWKVVPPLSHTPP